MLFPSSPFRAVDELLQELMGAPARSTGLLALDAYRRGDDVWLHVDLPGIPPESIEVTVVVDRLEISVNRERHHRPDDRLYATERPVGQLSRTIRLGPHLDADRLEADYHDGVLTVRIPVSSGARSRKIPITPGRSAAIDVESTLVDPDHHPPD